jgi:hypothetical protein
VPGCYLSYQNRGPFPTLSPAPAVCRSATVRNGSASAVAVHPTSGVIYVSAQLAAASDIIIGGTVRRLEAGLAVFQLSQAGVMTGAFGYV